MPRATVTARQLKNKDTGLDLMVTSYKEIKGMMTSTVYYQVVLVSNLACFKTPNHKESDIVQYSIEKKISEFEDLRNKMSETFTGIVLPPISKKSLIVSEAVLRERRNSLDHLLKFFASVERLATCPALLQFLGVDAVRAKKFSRGESLEGSAQPLDPGLEEKDGEDNDPVENVFEEKQDNQADSDLFEGFEENQGDDDLFSTDQSQPSMKVQMFEEQDMKRDLTEEDEKNMGLSPDIIITKKERIQVGGETEEEEEDQSDLFEIEDDLDQLLTVDVGKRKKQNSDGDPSQSSLSATTAETAAVVQEKPVVPSKPKPSTKPSIAPKPKANNTEELSSNTTSLPSAKPVAAPRPKPAPRSKPPTQTSKEIQASSAAPEVESLAQDDIMKYLQENSSTEADEVDLFS